MPAPKHLSDLAANILNRSLGRKGQIGGFMWQRALKTRKGVSSLVTKEVRCVARVGIEYDNQRAVKEGRESGELPAVNQGLPWGQWLQYPYLIEHKDNLYLRIYPMPGHMPKEVYRLNGQIARREEVEPLCLASEFKPHESCICLNLNHLLRIK